MNAKRFGKNLFMTLIIPVVVYIAMFILCNATGNPGFGVGNDINSIIYLSIYSTLIALAMTINLTSGRFDFSVGATMVLSMILGGNIAAKTGANALGLLLLTMLFGALIGLVSGLVYIILGLPPMVVSLGLAMIYEAIGFVYNRAKGVSLIGKTNVLVFSKQPWGVVVIIVVVVVLTILWRNTKFGYNRAALQTGQKIATDAGINEKKNAVICYVIAGILLAIAGCVYISKYGKMDPQTGLSSSAYFMTAFLPLFISGAIEKYCPRPIGVCIGAITQAFLTSAFTWLGCSSSLITVLNGVIVMIFLIYTSNSYKLVEQRMFKEKLDKIRAARAEAEKSQQ